MVEKVPQFWVSSQIEEAHRKLLRASSNPKSYDFLSSGATYLLENYIRVLKGDLKLPDIT